MYKSQCLDIYIVHCRYAGYGTYIYIYIYLSMYTFIKTDDDGDDDNVAMNYGNLSVQAERYAKGC